MVYIFFVRLLKYAFKLTRFILFPTFALAELVLLRSNSDNQDFIVFEKLHEISNTFGQIEYSIALTNK